MARFRKKPVIIEAITFEEFVNYAKANTPFPHWNIPYTSDCEVTKAVNFTHESDTDYIFHNGNDLHHLRPTDMLITGVNGEVYPCPKDVFNKTYEPVSNYLPGNGFKPEFSDNE